MVGLLIRWILMGFHVRTKSLNRSSHQRGSVTVAAHKFRRRTKGKVENVVEHEDLAVALRTSANANRRSANFPCNHARYFPRDTFEKQAGHAGAVERVSVAPELFNPTEVLSLHLVPAHDVDRLRCQTNMPRHRNLGIDDPPNQVSSLPATLDLYDFRSPFLHKPSSIAHGV